MNDVLTSSGTALDGQVRVGEISSRELLGPKPSNGLVLNAALG